jgi:CO/xanthine dehydrogenase Mo-binding subunit
VIHDVTCKDGKLFPKARPDRCLTFAQAVGMVQKANRGEPVIGRGSYTPRNKGLVSPAFSFGAQIAEVEVDKDTGIVEVKKMTTAHDCGTVINPMAVEGQLEGSVHMGLGYALCEQLVMREGKTLNTSFLDYKLPSAVDMPPGESLCVETYEDEGPLGAKESGEGLVSPTAPAIAEAVFHATGYRCKNLPITPDKVLAGVEEVSLQQQKKEAAG